MHGNCKTQTPCLWLLRPGAVPPTQVVVDSHSVVVVVEYYPPLKAHLVP
jgi:hypothetical protein